MTIKTGGGRASVLTAASALLLSIMIVSCTGAGSASDDSNASERTVEGLRVYLGVVPAELVRGHDPGTASQMHEQSRTVPESHHVMVAIFDAASGARFPSPNVVATIRPGRGSTVSRTLEPMVVNGALTFGNYFTLPDDGSRSSIEIQIARPGTGAVTARFSYRHSP